MNLRLVNWIALAVVVLTGAVLTGCVSKSNARLRASSAYFAGRAQGLEQGQTKKADVVSLVGPVRNPTIPWTEGLTLAEAIVAAEYTGVSDPRSIYLTRNGTKTFINPKQLLRGADFLVEAGDVVEIFK